MDSSIKLFSQAQIIDNCNNNNHDDVDNGASNSIDDSIPKILHHDSEHLGLVNEDTIVETSLQGSKNDDSGGNEEDQSGKKNNYMNGEAIEDEKETMKDALPITIMLRNCFPPNVYNGYEGENKGRNQTNGFMKNESTCNNYTGNEDGDDSIHNASKTMQTEIQSDNNTTAEDEEENDTTLDNYHIFTKTNQWRDQAKKIIFLPIEMEIVVTYEFLVQFHSHQKNETTRSRIRDLFGLDISNANTNSSVCKKNENEKLHQKRSHEGGTVLSKERVVVLCSKLQDTRSSHPLWDHVNEKLDDLYDLIPREHDLWSDLYKAMRIQFRAIVPSKADSETFNCKSSKSILLATCPLHPYKLKPITLSSQNGSSGNSASSPLIGASKFRDNIPYSVPPNSILIHYSDGTTRVSPELFQILGENELIDIQASSSQLRFENMDVDKFARRFDDDVFDVLEDKGYVKAKLQLGDSAFEKATSQIHDETNGSSSSSAAIVGPGRDAIATVDKSNTNDHHNGFLLFTKQAVNHQSSQPSSRPRGAFADAFDSMGFSSEERKVVLLGTTDMDEHHNDDQIVGNASSNNTMIEANGKEVRKYANEWTGKYEKKFEYLFDEENERKIYELESEIQQLELNLLDEEEALQQSIGAKEMSSICLKELAALAQKVENEVDRAEKELETPMKLAQQTLLFVNWRQKQMLKSLARIYPIQVLPDSVYTIRGIHLPNDMHSLTAVASDEIISAGLGFVCHVVSLCSKYLAIPLRYRVICNSSRSAVRDDVDVYPLFKERVVEKEQFDRAIVLLHRNIDLLIEMSGLSSSTNITMARKSKPVHILSKLDYLFHGVVENPI